MRFGILLGDVPAGLRPEEQLELTLRQVEVGQEAGFTHFTLGQHFVYGQYAWHQPIPLLARLAAEVDERCVLGTGVVLAPLYHPVLLAEEVATLDVICGGRLVLGLGTGYREAEFDALGVPFDERIPRLEECIELLRRLWREDEVDFDGRFWSLEGATPHLRPISPGGPPIWLGAKSRAAVRRAARLADSWLVTSKLPFDELRVRWAQYVAERLAAGRPVEPLPANRYIALGPDRETALARHYALTGERLDEYEKRELDIDDPIVRETRDATQTGFVGTAAECAAQIRALVADVPLDPIYVRVAWPSQSADDVAASLRELGRELIPMLADLEVSVSDEVTALA